MKNNSFTTTLIIIAILNLFISTTEPIVRIASSAIIVLIAEIINIKNKRKDAAKKHNEDNEINDALEKSIPDDILRPIPSAQLEQCANDTIVINDSSGGDNNNNLHDNKPFCKYCGCQREKYQKCPECGKGLNVKYIAGAFSVFFVLVVVVYIAYSLGAAQQAKKAEVEFRDNENVVSSNIDRNDETNALSDLTESVEDKPLTTSSPEKSLGITYSELASFGMEHLDLDIPELRLIERNAYYSIHRAEKNGCEINCFIIEESNELATIIINTDIHAKTDYSYITKLSQFVCMYSSKFHYDNGAAFVEFWEDFLHEAGTTTEDRAEVTINGNYYYLTITKDEIVFCASATRMFDE